MKELKHEYKEYRIENQNKVKETAKFEEQNNQLKQENKQLTMQSQKYFSDLNEARKQLFSNNSDTNDMMMKL